MMEVIAVVSVPADNAPAAFVLSLQELQVTSDHSLDHVYSLPLVTRYTGALEDPHREFVSLRVLLILLSVHGRVIYLARKEKKNVKTSCQEPFSGVCHCLALCQESLPIRLSLWI